MFMRLLSKLLIFIICLVSYEVTSQIPLPEHPRPDFKRPMWENLNGVWNFKFDQENHGLDKKWYLSENIKFEKKNHCPFSLGV